jgi:hypothetical protein
MKLIIEQEYRTEMDSTKLLRGGFSDCIYALLHAIGPSLRGLGRGAAHQCSTKRRVSRDDLPSIDRILTPKSSFNGQPMESSAQPANLGAEQGQRYVWNEKHLPPTHIQCFAEPSQSGVPKNVPIYLLQPIPGTDEDLTSQQLKTFIAYKRKQIESGWQVQQVLSPLDIFPKANSDNMTDPQNLSVCQWVVAMLNGMGIAQQPESLALTLLCSFFLTVRDKTHQSRGLLTSHSGLLSPPN